MCDLGPQPGIEPLHQEPIVLATGHHGNPLKAILKDALAMTHMIFQNDRSLFFFSTSSLSYFSMKVKNPTILFQLEMPNTSVDFLETLP